MAERLYLDVSRKMIYGGSSGSTTSRLLGRQSLRSTASIFSTPVVHMGTGKLGSEAAGIYTHSGNTRFITTAFERSLRPGNRALKVHDPSRNRHMEALRNLSDKIQSMTGESVGNVTDALRDLPDRIKSKFPEQKDREENVVVTMFQDQKHFLMREKIWTYGAQLAYQRKILANIEPFWDRLLGQKNPSLNFLRKEIRVLSAMTPVELQSNHREGFSIEDKRLIAEKADVKYVDVERVLDAHDMLRSDRRWYAMLTQWGRPHPISFRDKDALSRIDKPRSETENDLRARQMDRLRRRSPSIPTRHRKFIYRHRSCGGNQWSTQAPKWAPRFILGGRKKSRVGVIGAGIQNKKTLAKKQVAAS